LHLEARYNYEGLDAGSAWLGYNFSGGETVEWELTPLFGVVFGTLRGVAPGYRGSVSWQRVKLYSEGEFVVDTADSSASYFYNWSELSLGLLSHLRAGVAIQHTHVYHSDREVQRGVLLGLAYERADLTGYVFNVGDQTPTVVIALTVTR
jgi:hypothetical protein